MKLQIDSYHLYDYSILNWKKEKKWKTEMKNKEKEEEKEKITER